MKVVNSLKAAKKRDKNCRIVRRLQRIDDLHGTCSWTGATGRPR